MKLRGSGTFVQAFKATHKLAKENDNPINGYFLILSIYIGATTSLPFITVYVIDALVETNNLSQFIYLAGLFFLINILKVLLRTIINIYTNKREFTYGKKLQSISMDCFFDKNGEFYVTNKTGDIMEVILDDNMQIAAFTYQVYRTVADLINSIAIICALIFLQWDLVLILLICVPFILIIQNNLEWKMDDGYSKLRDESAKESSITEEFVSNGGLIASYGIKKKCKKKYAKMINNISNVYREIITLSHSSFGIQECFIVLSISIVVIYEGYKIFMGNATIGVLVAFIQYSDFLTEPGRMIAILRVQGNKLIPSIKRINKLWNNNKRYYEGSRPDFKNYDVVFKKMGFSYPNGKKVFENVNLKMEENKTHIIIGASGQGKTTMVHLITSLWEVTEGVLCIGGYPIDKINVDYLRKQISLVSQDNLFFNETLRESLVGEENQHTDEELYLALDKVGMLQEVKEMLKGLDTELGDRGFALSGGQRQRLAIARALLKDSPIIIFDEPTSALDDNTENIVIDAIKKLNGKTIFVITHKKSLRSLGDYIYEINNGNITRV